MCRILVADDDAEQLVLWKTVLESGGHEVRVALCVAGTLQQLAAHGADLIMMDLRFPNAAGDADAAEGRALIRGIRDHGCEAPVIVMSGWPEALEGQPEARMVSRVMVKPVRVAALLAAIAELVAG